MLGNRNSTIGNRGTRLPCLSSDSAKLRADELPILTVQHNPNSYGMSISRDQRNRTDSPYRRTDSMRNSVGRTRAPNGSACQTCRRKKIKVSISTGRSAYALTIPQCTGERPTCTRCDRLRQDCRYGDELDIGDLG